MNKHKIEYEFHTSKKHYKGVAFFTPPPHCSRVQGFYAAISAALRDVGIDSAVLRDVVIDNATIGLFTGYVNKSKPSMHQCLEMLKAYGITFTKILYEDGRGGPIFLNREVGQKHDEGKPQYHLLPPKALEDVIKVLTYGAKKYSPEGWRNVSNGRERYFDAANRHLWAWKAGEELDPESGLPHLAHAMANLMFLSTLP